MKTNGKVKQKTISISQLVGVAAYEAACGICNRLRCTEEGSCFHVFKPGERECFGEIPSQTSSPPSKATNTSFQRKKIGPDFTTRACTQAMLLLAGRKGPCLGIERPVS